MKYLNFVSIFLLLFSSVVFAATRNNWAYSSQARHKYSRGPVVKVPRIVHKTPSRILRVSKPVRVKSRHLVRKPIHRKPSKLWIRHRFFPRPKPQPPHRRYPPHYWRHYWNQWDAWYGRYHSYPRRFNWVIYTAGIAITTAAIIAYTAGPRRYYICQAYYDGGIYPGKLAGNICYVPYAGRPVVLRNYRILTGTHFQWISASDGAVPQSAIAGGYDKNGVPLYVCRAAYQGRVHPGYVVDSGCRFVWNNQVFSIPNYQVLAY